MVKVDLVSTGDFTDVIYKTSYNVSHSISETLRKELQKCNCNCGGDTIIKMVVKSEQEPQPKFTFCCNQMQNFAQANLKLAVFL